MTAAPATTRASRLGAYVAEMFPPWMLVPGTLASVAGVYFSLCGLAGARPATIDARVVAGGFTVILVSLLMRVYDELKDLDTDLRLGRAGDPRYANRAIVTGRVKKEDIVALRWGTTIALVALNVALGWPWPGVAFVVMMLATWLSFRWFFWPRVQHSLLLAFVTHNPVSVLFTAYIVAVFMAEHGGAVPPLALVVLAGHWGPVAAWEIARKVRAPDEETDYVTYSRVLGPRVAALLPVAFVAISLASLVAVAERVGVSRAYAVALVVAAAPFVATCASFAIAPSSRASARLRPLAELYAAAVGIATPIAFGVSVGVALAW